jgi:hypothetical protein
MNYEIWIKAFLLLLSAQNLFLGINQRNTFMSMH